MAPNPRTWTCDEVILMLDLYLRSGRKVLESHHPWEVELVPLLNRIRADALSPEVAATHVRTGGSVKAKLANLRALDPATESTGWGNVGRVDREVWVEFAEDPEGLAEVVARVRGNKKERNRK